MQLVEHSIEVYEQNIRGDDVSVRGGLYTLKEGGSVKGAEEVVAGVAPAVVAISGCCVDGISDPDEGIDSSTGTVVDIEDNFGFRH